MASASQIDPKVTIWIRLNASPKSVIPSTSMPVGAVY